MKLVNKKDFHGQYRMARGISNGIHNASKTNPIPIRRIEIAFWTIMARDISSRRTAGKRRERKSANTKRNRY